MKRIGRSKILAGLSDGGNGESSLKESKTAIYRRRREPSSDRFRPGMLYRTNSSYMTRSVFSQPGASVSAVSPMPEHSSRHAIPKMPKNFTFTNLIVPNRGLRKKTMTRSWTEIGDQKTFVLEKEMLRRRPNTRSFSEHTDISAYSIGEAFVGPAESLYKEYRGRILEMSKERDSCVELQEQVDKSSGQKPNPLVDLIFSELRGSFVDVMCNMYGNYLFQKILGYLSERQIHDLLKEVTPKIGDISVNSHGSRAVQKLLEFLEYDADIFMLVNEVSKDIVKIGTNVYGNHVLIKITALFPSNQLFVLFAAISASCYSLCTDKHGCSIVQKFIGLESKLKHSQMVIDRVFEIFDRIVNDRSGYFVCIYLIKEGIKVDSIVRLFGQRDLTKICREKFSSNVFEKLITKCSVEQREFLIEKLIQSIEGAGGSIMSLISDPYGNYVVQTVLKFAPKPQLKRLTNMILPVFDLVMKERCGPNIQKILRERGYRF